MRDLGQRRDLHHLADLQQRDQIALPRQDEREQFLGNLFTHHGMGVDVTQFDEFRDVLVRFIKEALELLLEVAHGAAV